LSKELRYDPKWLAILKKTSFLENASRSWPQIPSDSKEFLVTEEDLKQVGSLFNDDCIIPLNFRQTATPQPAWRHDPKVYGAHYYRLFHLS
jgi:hypothetical protein